MALITLALKMVGVKKPTANYSALPLVNIFSLTRLYSSRRQEQIFLTQCLLTRSGIQDATKTPNRAKKLQLCSPSARMTVGYSSVVY